VAALQVAVDERHRIETMAPRRVFWQTLGDTIRRIWRTNWRTDALDNTSERKKPGPKARLLKGFRWWRGQDLNLRPSGYEVVRHDAGWCRSMPKGASLQGFPDLAVPADRAENAP